MERRIRILRELLVEAISNIDKGNSNHTEDELDAITETLNINKDNFKKKYLEEDEDKYIFKTKGCQFLNNNNCKVKKCLPKSCKDYPFTDKEDRLYSMYSIIDNASICPVVYEY